MEAMFNKKEFKDYNLIILEDNHFDRFKKRRELIPVAGRDGDLIVEDGSYDNLELYIKVFSESEDNISTKEIFATLEKWLNVEDYSELKFEDGYIFSAKYLEIQDIKQIYKNNFEFTIKFTCKKID